VFGDEEVMGYIDNHLQWCEKHAEGVTAVLCMIKLLNKLKLGRPENMKKNISKYAAWMLS
jgi:hypothetical protein